MIRWIAVLIGLVACTFAGALNANAQTYTVTMSATIDGQDLGVAAGSDPVRLEPDSWADVAVELTNSGNEAVRVRRVGLVGRVVGLTFFSYSTTVDLTLPPGGSDTLRYQLDLTDLGGQATGLIGGELAVADTAGNTIVAVPTVTDVRGSLFSVYGLFGIALVVLTALALVDVALALARHRLPANRWQRGLRFLAPGVGIGLVSAFSTSVARIWVPETGRWLVLAGFTAVAFFALGYFSPTPDDEDDDDIDYDDLDEDRATTAAGETDDAPGAQTRSVSTDEVGQ